MSFSPLKSTLVATRSFLGLDEARCAHCLAPYRRAKTRDLRNSPISDLLCDDCRALLRPYSGEVCADCGRPVDPRSFGVDGRLQCGACANDPPPWTRLSFYGLYKNALRDLILRLKFDGDLVIARLFADFLFYICKDLPRPDLLIPIPQHPSRLRRRGYNQAHEIAKAFAKKCRLPCDPHILRRIKAGAPQEQLNAAGRRDNLRGAFACASSLANLDVWLIDDVLTTGSTCREATTALLMAGARETRVIFIARADS